MLYLRVGCPFDVEFQAVLLLGGEILHVGERYNFGGGDLVDEGDVFGDQLAIVGLPFLRHGRLVQAVQRGLQPRPIGKQRRLEGAIILLAYVRPDHDA